MEEKNCSNQACKRRRSWGALALTEDDKCYIGLLECVFSDGKERWVYNWYTAEPLRRFISNEDPC